MKNIHSPSNLGKLVTAVLAGLLLVGCEANGGGGGGGLIGGEPGSFFPNDGTIPTTVTEDTNGNGNGDLPGEVIPGTSFARQVLAMLPPPRSRPSVWLAAP